MPTVIAQPPKGAFHLPAVFHDLKAFAGVLDDFQVHLVRLLQAANPVAQPLRLIAAIDPDFPETGHAGGKIPLQQRDQSEPIIRIGGCHHHCDDPPQRIHQDMPFAPFDFLVPIKADILPLRRRLNTLAVGTARGRFGQATLALAFPLPQGVHHTSPDTRLPPAAKVAINRVRIANIRGEHAPLAPRFVDVENAVDDAAEFQGLPPRSTGTPLVFGQQELEQTSPAIPIHIWGGMPTLLMSRKQSGETKYVCTMLQ